MKDNIDSLDSEVNRILRDFEKNPESIGLSKIKDITEEPLILFRLQVKVLEKGYTFQDDIKTITTYKVGDETGIIDIDLWNNLADSLEEGISYEIRNIKSKIHPKTENIMLTSQPDFTEIIPISKEINVKDNLPKVRRRHKKPVFKVCNFERTLFEDYLQIKEIVANYLTTKAFRGNSMSCIQCRKQISRSYSDFLKFPYCSSSCEKCLHNDQMTDKDQKKARLGPIETVKKEMIKLSRRKKLSGSEFFPLTFSVYNIGKPRQHYVKITNTDEKFAWILNEVVICPEFENCMDLGLWIRNSSKFNDFLKEFRPFMEKPKEDIHAKLSGNYYYVPPNHLWRGHSKLQSTEGYKDYYNWCYAPYLKDVANKLKCFSSPTTFGRITFENKEHLMSFRTVIGFFDYLQEGQASFTIPTDNGLVWNDIFFNLSKTYYEKFKDMEKHSLMFCLIGNEFLSESSTSYLMKHESFEGNLGYLDILTHIIKYKLYMSYLENDGLFSMTEDSYNQYIMMLHDKFQYKMKQFGVDTNILRNFENYLNSSLNKYFSFKHGGVYYVPKILRDVQVDEAELPLIDDLIRSKDFELLKNVNSISIQDIRNIMFVKDMKRVSVGCRRFENKCPIFYSENN
ncbi:MAG: hypothetical protein GF364_03120 [Candidatus Lokiarchaeota archaeon]|nr:hypothetical protein [Candidatus Lokiarchaeota archaeon]